MRRLLIRPGAIGDVIVSLPALEFLKSDFTEVWVPSVCAPLIRFADKVTSIAASRIEMLADGFAERFRGFDEVYSWYNADRETLARLNPGCRFFRAIPEGTECASDFFLRQVGAPLGTRPKIRVERNARDTIAMHPFSGSARKNWGYEKFLELERSLPLPVEWAQDRFENLLELGEWIAGARLYIGNDSGITHLAAAVETPVIGIFRASEPRVWGCYWDRVLENPSVEEVRQAASEQLAYGRR